MNLAPVMIGAVLGALGATPAPAGGVLICTPFGCRSSPYFPPPIVLTRPPVIWQQASPGRPQPFPPLGPDEPPPAYPLAPPVPRGLRPSYAPPPPPLGNPPQWRQPPQAEAPPRVDSTPAPPSRREAQEQHAIEADIMQFCDAHPDEAFCGRLGAWLRAHPRP
jgi:hypothetical protein